MLMSEIEDRRKLSGLVSQALAGSSAAVADAVTLPPAAYTSQAFYELEVASIFHKEWLCVGHVSQVANVGDYLCVDLLGEALVIVRGRDRIRVLSRVCLHRWAPVVSGQGNASVFSCPFHKWTYALDGRLMGAPHMEQAAGFEPRDCALPEIRTEIVDALGLIFVTFDAAIPPLAPRMAGLIDRVQGLGFTRDLVVVDAMEIDNHYNWKILVETYMECYHHIGAHSKSLQPTKPGGLSFCEDEKDGWSVCHSIAKKDLTEEERARTGDNQLILFYPMLLLGVRPGHYSFQVLLPEGPGRTRLRRYSLGTPEARDDTEKLAASRARMQVIVDEDNAVNDLQQIGAASMLAPIGRLSHLEGSVWHLAQYVRSRIAVRD